MPQFLCRCWIIAGRKFALPQQKPCCLLLLSQLPSALLQPSPFIFFPSQDPFKYSYPPLPDDDFQTPICDNGPIVSEDEVESKDGESEVKDVLESSFSSEVAVKPKKVRSLFLLQVLLQNKSPNKSDSQPHWASPCQQQVGLVSLWMWRGCKKVMNHRT